MSYDAIYRARAAANAGVLDVFVPQIFGEVPIKVTESVGGQVTGMGWVMFQGGDPAYPVWLADIGLGSGSTVDLSGLNEVWIGPDPPIDPGIELWYDTDAVIPAPVWVPVTMATNVSAAFSNPPHVRIDGDMVDMVGAITLAAGFATYSAGTIPVGYRPQVTTLQGQTLFRSSGSPAYNPAIISVTAAGSLNIDGTFAPGWVPVNMRWRL